MHAKVTRRMITGRMGLIFGSLAAAPLQAQTEKPATTIHYEIDYKTTSPRIYSALLDAKQFSAFTNQPAEIDPTPGGAFRLFGGAIEGRNVELIDDRRIVQAWRPAYWPAGLYSIVKFELAAHGSGARIILDHTGFTEDKWQGLNEGWPLRYWDPLRKYLASPK